MERKRSLLRAKASTFDRLLLVKGLRLSVYDGTRKILN